MSRAKLNIEQKREKRRVIQNRWYANLSEEKKNAIREKNRVRMREYSRKNRSKIAEAHREYAKKYRKEHSPEISENIKKWVEEHRERSREIKRKWDNEHPDNIVERRHRRRAKEKDTGEHFTAYEWRLLCNEYGNICLKCGQKKKLTPDHVVPISLGGSNSIKNIQPLCLECNLQKHTNIVDYRKSIPIHVEQLSFEI